MASGLNTSKSCIHDPKGMEPAINTTDSVEADAMAKWKDMAP